MQRRMWVTGILLVVAGAGIALVPFVLPALDTELGTGTAGAWEWTRERGLRQVVAGGAVALGGILVLVRRRWVAALGGLVAAAGGAWVAVAPVTLGPVDAAGRPETLEVVRDLAHATGSGGLILLGAGFVLGRLWQHWRFERTPIPLPSQQWAAADAAGNEPVARGRPW